MIQGSYSMPLGRWVWWTGESGVWALQLFIHSRYSFRDSRISLWRQIIMKFDENRIEMMKTFAMMKK